MPGWHEATKELQEAGKLQMVGIIQEQHPNRARLFMRLKEMDWPILVDSLNLLDVEVVPLTLLIDEHGVIRRVQPRKSELQQFLETRYEAGPESSVVELSDADRQFLQSPEADLDSAIARYQEGIRTNPEDGRIHFRLGVAYRKRYDSSASQPGDFRRAIEHWSKALEINPNQYIWRRRIQQYGPRLDKPYSFYDWILKAREDIRARGDEVPKLAVEPGGAEFAIPQKEFATEEERVTNPDPLGKIYRDEEGLIAAETVIVPHTGEQERTARVHVVLKPNLDLKAHWNNEVDDLLFWVDPPRGWQVDRRLIRVPIPPQAISQETRRVEFEIRGPQGGEIEVPAYALYYVCEDIDGTCLYRRQDFNLRIPSPE